MADRVQGSRITQEDLRRFFDQVKRLRWEESEPTSDAIRREAEIFARANPRPDLPTLRSHVDHAVATAQGWDHPGNRAMMFDAAVEAFYILAWLDHLQQKAREGDESTQIDLELGVKITFTPLFET